MLKGVDDVAVSSGNAAGGSLLDELVWDGARQMLAAALQAEVAAYVEAHADQLDADGRLLGVGNGSHAEREVLTAAGAIAVRAPRVNDKRVDEATGERTRFSSAILPAWSRRNWMRERNLWSDSARDWAEVCPKGGPYLARLRAAEKVTRMFKMREACETLKELNEWDKEIPVRARSWWNTQVINWALPARPDDDSSIPENSGK